MSLREQPNFMTGPRTKLPQAKRSESGKAGNSGAMFLLGEMHEEGLGVAFDYYKARDLYKEAQDAGSGEAKNALSRVEHLTSSGEGKCQVDTRQDGSDLSVAAIFFYYLYSYSIDSRECKNRVVQT
jgi:TPR repeat protein